MNDDLGDRMKFFEGIEAGRRFIPTIPVMARLDGRGFSKFTKGMDRPYDARMAAAMVGTTIDLVRATGASMGYTQSDEITLVWHSTDIKSQVYFDGRIAKMTSQLAAQATLMFYRKISSTMDHEYAERLPTFDARVWNLPNQTEAANAFLWREWDATKNSISMAASHYYHHSELTGKNGSQKQDMLHAVGVNWNDYPAFFKRGTYAQRCVLSSKFSDIERWNLPPKHAAHSNPDLVVDRTVIRVLDMGPFTTVKNREAVIFDGATPVFE